MKNRGPARKQNTGESAGVATSGKLKTDSPLAGYQWRPGESGNPAGRPKTSDLKAEVRAFADESDPKIRKTRLRVWLEMADRRARQGSPKHLEMLLAYGWGRPSQAIEMDANVNYAEILDKVRKARERAEAPDAFLPVPTRGSSDAQTAPAATARTGQDSAREDPEQPMLRGPIKRIVM